MKKSLYYVTAYYITELTNCYIIMLTNDFGTVLNRCLFLLLASFCSSIDKRFLQTDSEYEDFIRISKAINVFNKNWYDYMSSSYVTYF